MNKVIIFLVFSLLWGCSYPVRKVVNADSRPGIVFDGASADDEVFLDGIKVGRAIDFSGTPNVMLVESGTHRVQVRKGSGVLVLEEKFFIDADVRVIRLGGGK